MTVSYYKWTAKHRSRRRKKWTYSCPKSYCKVFNQKHRAMNRSTIRSYFVGNIDEDRMEAKLVYQHRHIATWMYW